MPALASTSEIRSRSKTAKKETILFECPHCDGRVRVPQAFAGRKGKCPKCKGVLRVPGERQRTSRSTPKPKRKPRLEESHTEALNSEEKDCRFCGETILSRASKCRHCGEWLDPKLRKAKRGGSRNGKGPREVHIVLKIWGVGIAALNGLGLASTLLLMILAGPKIFMVSMVRILIGIVMIRLGIGLYRGERSAVIGMGVLAGLASLFCMLVLVNAPAIGMVMVAIVGAMYGPPILVGYQNWKRLK